MKVFKKYALVLNKESIATLSTINFQTVEKHVRGSQAYVRTQCH